MPDNKQEYDDAMQLDRKIHVFRSSSTPELRGIGEMLYFQRKILKRLADLEKKVDNENSKGES